ncbi:hypothetical protein CMT52_18860 [Elizabethkingia anophelis]|nr:hypothetical protein [Elizabethkingia anophelis]MDV4026393.1 hypothetical protein [Elizabethkingia anophelis]
MRRAIIFILLFTLLSNVQSQTKIPIYRKVSICGQEGMSDEGNFRMIGEQRYLSIIKDFEKEFRKINNGYSNYYRLYSIHGGMKPTDLFIYLIPKSIVSEENRKKIEYRVFGDKRTLWLYYDLKTNKVSKPSAYILNPDI